MFFIIIKTKAKRLSTKLSAIISTHPAVGNGFIAAQTDFVRRLTPEFSAVAFVNWLWQWFFVIVKAKAKRLSTKLLAIISTHPAVGTPGGERLFFIIIKTRAKRLSTKFSTII